MRGDFKPGGVSLSEFSFQVPGWGSSLSEGKAGGKYNIGSFQLPAFSITWGICFELSRARRNGLLVLKGGERDCHGISLCQNCAKTQPFRAVGVSFERNSL